MDNQEKWNAILNNAKQCDGRFYYAVKSTRIFCRPSCASKPPREENVVYFDTAAAAIEAGYRPCKRCRPDLSAYEPAAEMAATVKRALYTLYTDRAGLAEELAQLGVSRQRLAEIFYNHYRQTPAEYANRRRLEAAKERLAVGNEAIVDMALALGFESLSAFYRLFKQYTQLSPGDFRLLHKQGGQVAGGSFYSYELALGTIAIATDGSSITTVQFADSLEGHGARRSSQLTDTAARQLEEYFNGKRKQFALPLNPLGTAFQQAVWTALQTIPYGATRSYKQVAGLIGNPSASRAVGMANNKNPLLIVIPCHRVVGADGSLTGYAASLAIKQRLLDLEQENLPVGSER